MALLLLLLAGSYEQFSNQAAVMATQISVDIVRKPRLSGIFSIAQLANLEACQAVMLWNDQEKNSIKDICSQLEAELKGVYAAYEKEIPITKAESLRLSMTYSLQIGQFQKEAEDKLKAILHERRLVRLNWLK